MTTWKQRTAGEPDPGVYDVSEELGTPALMLADRPDWVRRPDTGEQLRVVDAVVQRGRCPSCQASVTARVLVLEQNINVLECPACQQFLFYRGAGA